MDFSRAVEKVLDAVIKIEREDGGIGSAAILKDGLILSCRHVVEGAEAISATLRDGRTFKANVIAIEPHLDLALLTLKGTDISQLPEGVELDPVELLPGQKLMAVGHPLGLEWSVSGGHYNARRDAEELSKFGIRLKTPLIQVDVVINRGNSGGPVIDMEGHMVGIATAIIDPSRANNIGFIIPVDTIISFWKEFRGKPSPVFYTCGHYHPPGLKFCPEVGKEIKPKGKAPGDETPEPGPTTRYSCGHEHPPGLAYCPLLGKPIKPIGGEK